MQTIDHLVCRDCGRTEDVDCAFEPSAELAGYRVDEAEVTFWGRCPACQEYNSSSAR